MNRSSKWMAAVVLAMCAAAAQAADNQYKVVDQWKIAGDGGWDYLAVDPSSHALYITRGNRVQVVDTSSGKLLTEITGLGGTHGVVFDPNGKYGYISDGAANMVRVFDRSTNQLVTSIPAGSNPDGMVYDRPSNRVFAFNGHSSNATVIDAKTNKVVGTIPLPGKPEFPVSDGKGTVFVNIEDKSVIVRIDVSAMKATATWPVAPCEEPSGLAIDTSKRRLFAVCGNKMMAVVDADSGKVVATPAIGDGPDAASFDAKKNLAFSSNGDGTLTVIKEGSTDKYDVVGNVQTQRSARTITLDPDTGKLYLVAAEFGPRPAATPDNPRPRPKMTPGTFTVLVVAPQ